MKESIKRSFFVALITIILMLPFNIYKGWDIILSFLGFFIGGLLYNIVLKKYFFK